MYISKSDALRWMNFFVSLPEGEALSMKQEEIILAIIRQIERSVEAGHQMLIDKLKKPNTVMGRTLYVGRADKMAKGCISCLTAQGLNAIRKTNRCNLRCAFCYDFGQMNDQPPVGDDYWEIGGTRFLAEDIELLLQTQKKPMGVSYVYLEPFLEIDKYEPVIRVFHKHGVYQHMYTNGTLVTEEHLQMLKDAGLDELRFNLAATNCSDKVIDAIRLAKRYLPSVGVESPMTPEFYESFLEKKDAILATGLDFINLAELHLNPNNVDNYAGHTMYISRMGYLSPVFSRDLSLQLMVQAEEENWDVCVHDCSNHTKFARDLNLRGKEGAHFGASAYHMEFDAMPLQYLLPALRDDALPFVREEPLPEGYRLGDLTWDTDEHSSFVSPDWE